MSAGLALALAGGVGVFAGALLTGLVTLVTTLSNRRHEQRRWLLDRRMEMYGALLDAWHSLVAAGPQDTFDGRLHAYNRFHGAYSRCALIADGAVTTAAERVRVALESYVRTGVLDPELGGAAVDDLESAMRRELMMSRQRPVWRKRLGAKRRARRILRQYQA